MHTWVPPRGWSIGIAALLATACRCTSPPQAEPAPPHWPGWPAFVGAAEEGDLTAARSLIEGLVDDGRRPPDGSEAGLGKLGAALGFVRFAEDTGELADAVASAAAGCGRCHGSAGATPPPRPEWAHHSAGRWAVWGLVWVDGAAPPAGGGEPLGQLAAAWSGPVPVDTGGAAGEQEVRVARVVAACAACHDAGLTEPAPPAP